MSKLINPEPGTISVWHFIGYLGSVLERDGKATVTDWNRAVKAAQAQHQRDIEAEKEQDQ